MALVGRSMRAGLGWSRAIALAVPALLIAFLAWPMLFTSSGLAQDWVGHLWEVWKQGTAISHDHAPSLFVSTGAAAFLPLFGYYGGTLFTLSGALSLALGGAIRAYVLCYLLAFAAAYGGWYWLARMAGLGRWLAHVPGFVFITSGYYLTLIYARGDFAEFSAVSEIPLMVAAGLHVLFTDRLRALPALALAGSTLVFFGSHNITLLWGFTLLVLLGVTILAAVPEARRRVTRAGVARVAALALPAALVNAWFLFPALAYGSRTWVSTGLGLGLAHNLYATKPLVGAGHLFTLSRAGAAPDTPDFVLALPILAIVWVLVGILLSLRIANRSPWRRLLLILAGAAVLLGIVMTHPRLILDLPRPYQLVQYSYRLETYVVLSLCCAMLAALVLLRRVPTRASRIWSWTLAAVLVASGVGAVQQVDTHPSVVPDRHVALSDYSSPIWAHVLDQQLTYSDATLPAIHSATWAEIQRHPILPIVAFPSTSIHDDHLTITVRPSAGSRLLDTNLAGAPEFVAVSGAQVVGRDVRRFMVLRLPAGGNGSARRISLASSNGLPLRLGRLVTFAALAFLVVLALLAMIRRRSRRTDQLRGWPRSGEQSGGSEARRGASAQQPRDGALR